MKCENCGNENKEEIKFCETCGEPTAREVEVVNNAPMFAETLKVEASNLEVSNLEVSNEENTEKETLKKKSKIPILILIIILLVGAVGAFVVFGQELLFKSDENKLIEAVKATSEAKQMSFVGEIGFNEFSLDNMGVMESVMIESLIEGIKIQYMLATDKEARKMEGVMAVALNGSQLIEIGIQCDKELIALSIPEIYSKTIYLKWKDVKDILTEYGFDSEFDSMNFDFDSMVKKFDEQKEVLDVTNLPTYKDLDHEGYEEIFEDYIKDCIESVDKETMKFDILEEEFALSGEVYNLDIKLDGMVDMLVLIVEKVINDKNIYPLVVEVIEKTSADIIEKKDVEVYNQIATMMEEDTIDLWDDGVERQVAKMKDDILKEIEDGYDKAMDEMKDGMKTDDYEEALSLTKKVLKEIDLNYKVLVNDGYAKGTYLSLEFSDSLVKAVTENEMVQDAMEENETLNDLDGMDEFEEIGFNVSLYMTQGYSVIDKAIEFSKLPNDALDFSELDMEDLMEIYEEIGQNIEGLMEGFTGM